MTIWWVAFAEKSSPGSSFDEPVANIFKPFFLYSGMGILLEIASHFPRYVLYLPPCLHLLQRPDHLRPPCACSLTYTLPLSFDEIIFNFVRIQGIRSVATVLWRRMCWINESSTPRMSVRIFGQNLWSVRVLGLQPLLANPIPASTPRI